MAFEDDVNSIVISEGEEHNIEKDLVVEEIMEWFKEKNIHQGYPESIVHMYEDSQKLSIHDHACHGSLSLSKKLGVDRKMSLNAPFKSKIKKMTFPL